MDVPARPFTLSDWALIVGIITTSVGALYAVWRVVLRPMLVAANRRFSEEAFKRELGELEHVSRAVQTLGRLQAELLVQIQDFDDDVEKIPVLESLVKGNERALERIERVLETVQANIVELSGRQGGRRRYDPPKETR